MHCIHNFTDWITDNGNGRMGIRNEPKTGSTSLQNRLRVIYTLAKTLSALQAIESRRLRSIADSVTVAIPSYRLISLTLLRFMCCGMPIVCCRWNASGRCKHCSCKKAGKECSNCLPRRRENWKLIPIGKLSTCILPQQRTAAWMNMKGNIHTQHSSMDPRDTNMMNVQRPSLRLKKPECPPSLKYN